MFRKNRRMFLVRTVVAPMNTDTTDVTVFIGSTLRHYVNIIEQPILVYEYQLFIPKYIWF